MVLGERIPATKDKERTVPLNDDPEALSDEEYDALVAEAEESAERCPAAVPADVVKDALQTLERGSQDG